MKRLRATGLLTVLVAMLLACGDTTGPPPDDGKDKDPGEPRRGVVAETVQENR